MDGNCKLVTLDKDMHKDEWEYVVQSFKKTCTEKIINVYRIQNVKLWKDYLKEKEDLSNFHKIHKLSSEIKEKDLWHGTRNTHPKEIYEAFDEGFDLQYSNDGMWGRGLYFAVNAKYSVAYSHTAGNVKKMMLVKVMVGDYVKLNPNGTLRKPPLRDNSGSKVRYDSVEGFTGGSDVYILYAMRRAYPLYLVDF